MANKPIIGRVTANSTGRTLEGGRVNVAGAWRTVAESYECVGGVWRPSWEKLFTWKKYNTITTTADGWAWSTKMSTVATTSSDASANGYDDRTPTFAVTYSNGEISKMTTSTYGMETRTAQEISESQFDYYQFTNPDDWRMGGHIPKKNLWYKASGGISSYGDTIEIMVYRPVYAQNITYSQGSYIADVTAETENAYPTNGRHSDGYWYVFQG